MTEFGYTLSSEEHGPRELVHNARRAEELGFDFCSISDHFHPWVQAQGHSPFVWGVLGGIASATDRIELAVGVTCPIVRLHPAIVAHAAATASLLLEGRFTLGVGTGEALRHRARFFPDDALQLRDLFELTGPHPGTEVLIDDRPVPYARELWLPLVWFLLLR